MYIIHMHIHAAEMSCLRRSFSPKPSAMILDFMRGGHPRPAMCLNERVLRLVAPQLLALLGSEDFCTLSDAADMFLDDTDFLWELVLD